MKTSIKKCGKKILSIVLTMAMIVSVMNFAPFVENVKAATKIIFKTTNSEITDAGAGIFVVEGTIASDSFKAGPTDNTMVKGKRMTDQGNGVWTAEVDSDVITFVRVSPASDGDYYWSWKWENTQRGSNNIYTATANNVGTWSTGDTGGTQQPPITGLDVFGKELPEGETWQMPKLKEDLAEITDVNGQQTSLYSAAAVMYNYKPGGGTNWWDQFKNFDRAIIENYAGREKMKYPLITGAVVGKENGGIAIASGGTLNAGKQLDAGSLKELTYDLAPSNLKNNDDINYNTDRALYSNRNLQSMGQSYKVVMQGLAADRLSVDGDLLSVEHGVKMPFFHDEFLTNLADKYGSRENPIAFPFRSMDDGWYEFDSAGTNTVSDTVYMNDNKQLTYNSSLSAQIQNLTDNGGVKGGFWPFNVSNSSNVDKTNVTKYAKQLEHTRTLRDSDPVEYGFGMRLDIPFNMPQKAGASAPLDHNMAKVVLKKTDSKASNVRTLPEKIKSGQYLVIYNEKGENINLDSVKIGNTTYEMEQRAGKSDNLEMVDDGTVGHFQNHKNSYIVFQYTGAETDSFDIQCRSYGSNNNSFIVMALNNWNQTTIDAAVEEALTKKLQDKVQNDVVFEFTGDDDLWVYVDGKLALDMGGAHSRAEGRINFTKGTVSIDTGVYHVDGSSVVEGAKKNDFSWLNFSNDKEEHTLTVFYMERGLFDSNLKIRFNFAPVKLTQDNGITVSNTIDYSKINPELQDITKDILKDYTFEYTQKDTTKPGTKFDETFDLTDGDNKHYNESYDVEETSGIRGHEFTVTQKEDDKFTTSNEFKSSSTTETGSTDGEELNRTFTFPNTSNDSENVQIDYLNVLNPAPITITKRLAGSNDKQTPFEFVVTYTIENSQTRAKKTGIYVGDIIVDGQKTKTAADGTITLTADQTATIEGFPMGFTTVNVQEKITSSKFDLSKIEVNDENQIIENKSANGEVSLTGADFVFTNAPVANRKLVYYTEINKKTDLPLPADLKAQTTKTVTTEPETQITQKTATYTVNANTTTGNGASYSNGHIGGMDNGGWFEITGIEGGYDGNVDIVLNYTVGSPYDSATIGMKVNGNDSNDFKLSKNSDSWDKFGDSGKVTVSGLKTGANNTIRLTGKVNAADIASVKVTYNVSEAVGSGATETQYINVYDKVDITNQTHNVNDAYIGTPDFTNGVAAESNAILNKLTFISKHVGYDKFTLTLHNNLTGLDEDVDVIVYNYNVNDHVYVLDYGLPVDLAKGANGLFDEKYYNPASNFSIDSPEDEAADGFTVFGFANRETGAGYATGLNYNSTDFAPSMNFNQGKVEFDPNNVWKNTIGKAVYTPTKFMSDVDTFYYGVQVSKDDTIPSDATNATPVMVGKVDVMPANIVYYEDNFSQSGNDADGKNGIIYSGNVKIYGVENTDSTQSNSLDMQYGYDPTYADQDYGNSDGGSHELYSSAMAAFEFTGTGFDIMSRTNRATGVVLVNIYNKTDATKIVKNGTILSVQNGWANKVTSLIVDTSYENGDLYQIPVITWRNQNGIKGDYIVTITSLAGNNEDAKSIYIDGIRIYNPAQSDPTADGKYDDNNELDADILEAKQLVLGKDFEFTYDEPAESNRGTTDPIISLAKYTGDGATFLSGKSVVESFNGYNKGADVKEADPNTARDMYTLAVSGPNNELYLNAGYGIAFGYSDLDNYQGTSKTLQIGIKNVKGSAFTLQYLKDVDGKAVWTDVAEIKSATELYYRIDTLEDKYDDLVYLRITGGEGYVSVTNLKKAGYELVSVQPEIPVSNDVNEALNPTNIAIKSGYNTRNKYFIKNQYATVKITTPLNVDDIKVYSEDGTEVVLSTVSSKAVNGAQEWTVKFKASKIENVQADTLYILAYDENGVKSQKMGFDGKVVQ